MALLPLLSSRAVKIDCCYERHEKPSDSGSWAEFPIYIAEGKERGEEGRKDKEERSVFISSFLVSPQRFFECPWTYSKYTPRMKLCVSSKSELSKPPAASWDHL